MNKKIIYSLFGIVMVLSMTIGVFALINVSQGEEVTVSKDISCVDSPDSDSSDGFVRYLYGAWVLKSPNGVMIDNQAPIQLASSNFHAETTFTAEELGNYEFYTSIFFVESTYNQNTHSWETTNSGFCQSPLPEVIEVNPSSPDLGQIVNVANELFQSWLDSIFGGQAQPNLNEVCSAQDFSDYVTGFTGTDEELLSELQDFCLAQPPYLGLNISEEASTFSTFEFENSTFGLAECVTLNQEGNSGNTLFRVIYSVGEPRSIEDIFSEYFINQCL